MAVRLLLLRPRRRSPRVPVLTYHALHAPGRDYATNDHIALGEDLRVIARAGFRIMSLRALARYFCRASPKLPEGRWVALSFDDGTDYDYLDVELQDIGYLKSFRTLLREAQSSGLLSLPKPAAVSFVIASPYARAVLDRTCIAGRGNWNDSWWKQAADEAVLGIGNHSWDHTHPTLDCVSQRGQLKGTFRGIDNVIDADAQIALAEQYLAYRTDDSTARLFAYPYGEAPEYLVREYFPNYPHRHRQLAAFGLGGTYVTETSPRWQLPRFSCGHDWTSPVELEALLRGALV